MRAWAVKDMAHDAIIFATLRMNKGAVQREAKGLNVGRQSKRYKAVPVEITEVTDTGGEK